MRAETAARMYAAAAAAADDAEAHCASDSLAAVS